MLDFRIASIGVGCFSGVGIRNGSEVVSLIAVRYALDLAEGAELLFGGGAGLASVEVLGDESKGGFVTGSFLMFGGLESCNAGLFFKRGEDVGLGRYGEAVVGRLKSHRAAWSNGTFGVLGGGCDVGGEARRVRLLCQGADVVEGERF